MGVCCYTFLKYIAMIFDLLYMMIGGALLGTILWLYLDAGSTAPVTADIEGYNYVLYFLMVVGAIMFIMGLLGCCGACHESQCMLATFFALVLVMFMGQVAIGVWLRANEERFTEVVSQSLASSIKRDYGRDDLKTKAFDIIQAKLKCCGSVSSADWAESRFNGADPHNPAEIGILNKAGTYKVPESCCMEGPDVDCEEARVVSLTVTQSNNIYSEGCAKKVLNLVKENSYEVLGCLMAMLLVQVLAMIFSMVLCCTVRRIDHVKA
ncbi:tetraspanin-1-like [Eriocheir sinensis]|uniref:tetraspanin-1-like n=1 Tax=Eriocheir sinensis TaxID=95602 RepID=UPI0021C7306A|nr:tetraspanin-1-like [Eriocheir sinensis]